MGQSSVAPPGARDALVAEGRSPRYEPSRPEVSWRRCRRAYRVGTLTPDYLFWFGAGLLATEPLSCRGGWLYALPADVFTAVDGNRCHGSSDPERH
jgi:hypothetical protein